MSVCAYCYSTAATLQACGKCSARKFCSRECQVRDWKHGHKEWCEKSGERDVDWTVRDSPGKGQGVFALREFHKGDKIIVERPLPANPNDWTIGMHEVCQELCPHDGSLLQKVVRNGMNCGQSDSRTGGLFLFLAKVNHSCVGNSTHFYIEGLDVKILVASRTIQVDEEITFSYAPEVPRQVREDRLRNFFHFQCSCEACLNPEVLDTLDRIVELDNKILEYCSVGQIKKALVCGKILIRLYDELNMCNRSYCRTYYDMFQTAIMKRSTVRQGVQYVRLAAEHADVYYGQDNPASKQYLGYAASPNSHRNYLKLDFSR